jgi:hypothetical protein
MLCIYKLIKQLPNELQNKIFFYAVEHETTIIFKNYKKRIVSKININRTFDFDYYMRMNPPFVIPYSYYRDITYNLFHSAHKCEQLSIRNKKHIQTSFII